MSTSKNNFKSVLATLMYAALAVIGSHTLLGPVLIPSESMEPTLYTGDYLLVNRMAYGVHAPFTATYEIIKNKVPPRGDIIVFNVPPDASVDESLYIKRVIGIPGDTITVKNHQLTINGIPLKYTSTADGLIEQLGNRSYNIKVGPSPIADFGPYTVPVKHVFVMGDNRHNSADSRVWGPLAIERIRGEAIFRLASFLNIRKPGSILPMVNDTSLKVSEDHHSQ